LNNNRTSRNKYRTGELKIVQLSKQELFEKNYALPFSEESKTYWINFKSSGLVGLLTVNGPARYLDICFTNESDLTFKEIREEPEISSYANTLKKQSG
jgi:hypothetical protein